MKKYYTKEEYDKKYEEGRQLAEQLEQFYRETEKNKGKRTLYTVAFYIIKNAIIVYLIFKTVFVDVKIAVFIPIIIISLVTGMVSYLINFSIFTKVFQKSREENETMERMKNRLAEISEELDLKPKYEIENFLMNKHM